MALGAMALPASAQSPIQDLLGIGAPPQVRQGTPTQAEGGPTAPGAAGAAQPQAPAAASQPSVLVLQPFGASLFTGTAPALTYAVNPNYIIQPGDRVSIRVWGGVTAESTDIVDQRGNVFLTGVGPLHVGGVTAGELQAAAQRQIGQAFTSNVQVYAVLQESRTVGIFVTGFVKTPGRYAGAASDSALDYLVRAGGVDPSRGSYRNITLQRAGKVVAQIDLYRFLLSGTVPPVNLQEGDAIVVEKQYPMLAADGAVRNNYLFEIPTAPLLGREIIDLARPLPAATHALVKGTRDSRPYSAYLTLGQLAVARLFDQDQVTFVTDAPPDTVSIEIQGSRIGPSVLVADRDIRLPDVLNYVAVDPRLADVKDVYILRKGLAEQQRRALQEALDRLEKSLFLAISPTTGVAQIRASEAQLIASYIQRARQVQPEGRLVVSEGDRIADLRMEDGDIVVIPQTSQVVLVSGEALLPQAVIHDPALTADDYVKRAGGFTERGRAGNYMIRRANGRVYLAPDLPTLRPGDELIVLPVIDPAYFQLGKDFVQVLYEIAVATNLAVTGF